MAQNISPREGEGLGELVGDILRDVQKLIQQESLLLRTEVRQEWDKAKNVAVGYSAGAVAARLAAVTGALFLVFALNAWFGLPIWAGFLIETAALGGTAFYFLRRGAELKKDLDLVPRQTVESVKENVTWFKKQTS